MPRKKKPQPHTVSFGPDDKPELFEFLAQTFGDALTREEIETASVTKLYGDLPGRIWATLRSDRERQIFAAAWALGDELGYRRANSFSRERDHLALGGLKSKKRSAESGRTQKATRKSKHADIVTLHKEFVEKGSSDTEADKKVRDEYKKRGEKPPSISTILRATGRK